MKGRKTGFCFLLIIVTLACQQANAQKYLFDADSCSAAGFPVITGQLYHRGYGDLLLKEENLEIREDGKPVKFTLKLIDNKKVSAKKKRVLFLIENHYQQKGIAQRNFFANVINTGIHNSILPGDQFMIATFDWQRSGKYIFPAFEQFTDDTGIIRSSLKSIVPPATLFNKQEGSDINSALNEAIQYLSPVNTSAATAIILFSDDLDNSVGKIVNLDIRNKALQANIPIYAVSYAMYSRYNPVMRDEICIPTYGRYFISPGNNIPEAAGELKRFLDGIVRDYEGSTFRFSFNSASQKNGQKLNLLFNIKNTATADAETLQVPAPSTAEKISRNLTAVIAGVVALLVLLSLIVFFIRRNRKQRIQQNQQLLETRTELSKQSELREKEKQATQSELNIIRQKETDKLAEDKRLAEESRLRQLMLVSGAFPSLHYSYKDTNGKVDVTSPLFTIGRDKSNSFYIQLDTVSRKHATILFDESGFYTIIDHASSNGTYVNGEKIIQASLKSDDHIQIGDINLIFHN
ncbi:MAG: FHA domain-containing protein [Chitinophagaceae bacterium]